MSTGHNATTATRLAEDELSRERRTTGVSRKIIAELSLELDQARDELAAAVT